MKQATLDLLLTAARAGLSDGEIADLLHMSRSTVQYARKSAGLRRKPGRKKELYDTPEDIRMCLSCNAKKCTGDLRRCKAELERKAVGHEG